MFGLGTSELLVVLALALIFLGPDKFPGMATKLGRFLRQLRQAAEEWKDEMKSD